MAASQEFGEQLMAVHKTLIRQAFRLTRDYHSAQDLVGDTLERACRFSGRFEAGTNLEAWTLRIQRNLWVSRTRRSDFRSTVPLSDDQLDSAPNHIQTTSPSPENEVLSKIGQEAVLGMIDALPRRLRNVAVQTLIENEPYDAIAKSLGIPKGTVASRGHRVRKRLQSQIRDVQP